MAEKNIFTLSVEAHAPMVDPELTDVGELHSLTDWQVSDASEEAELDEFWKQGRRMNGILGAINKHRKAKGKKKLKHHCYQTVWESKLL